MSLRISSHYRLTGAILLASVISATTSGCGGGGNKAAKTVQVKGSHQITVDTSRKATARFVIHWPQKATRAIPANTNRLIIYVHAGDIKGALVYVADRPAYSDTTTLNVDIPAGPKRQFAVEARQIPDSDLTYTGGARAVPFDSPDLKDGTILGGGNDLMAHDIGVGDTINASVTVNEAAKPAQGTTGVAVTLTQVLPTSFPSVLVLQLIRDQNGNPITDLNVGNFTVTEDTKPVVVTDVRTVQQAASNLSVSLVLDRSGSMAGQKNADMEGAASQFVSLLQPNDYGEIINFSDTVDVTQAFTNDKSMLTQAIQGRDASGATALFDGIFQAVTDTGARGGRQAVIAMTDGLENSSSHSQDDILQAAHQQVVPVFTVGLGSDADQSTLQNIASKTNGTFTFAPSSSDLKGIYSSIANQLNGQIQLSFISPNITVSGVKRHVVVDFHYGAYSGHNEYDYVQ